MTEIAAFLDRDGTVCKHVPYLSTVENFELLPTVADGIRLVNEAGIKTIVVTNQSGIGRGYFTREAADAIHDAMVERLAAAGATIDDIYLCPHHPDDDCSCRKPGTDMLYEAAQTHDIDLESSFLIGDRASDIQAGARVGATTILFPSSETARDPADVQADHTVEQFRDAVDIIVAGHETF